MALEPKKESSDSRRRNVNDMFDMMERDFAQSFGLLSRFPSPFFSSALFPSLSLGRRMYMDLQETAGEFELAADLPGVAKEDITIDVDENNNVLTLSGERKQEREEKEDDADGNRKYHYMERSYGKVSRSVRLPENADPARARAAYNNGVLHLTFPKRAALPSSHVKIAITDGTADSGGSVAIGRGGNASGAGVSP